MKNIVYKTTADTILGRAREEIQEGTIVVGLLQEALSSQPLQALRRHSNALPAAARIQVWSQVEQAVQLSLERGNGPREVLKLVRDLAEARVLEKRDPLRQSTDSIHEICESMERSIWREVYRYVTVDWPQP